MHVSCLDQFNTVSSVSMISIVYHKSNTVSIELDYMYINIVRIYIYFFIFFFYNGIDMDIVEPVKNKNVIISA